jgi:hypothetical protein
MEIVTAARELRDILLTADKSATQIDILGKHISTVPHYRVNLVNVSDVSVHAIFSTIYSSVNIRTLHIKVKL